MRIFGAGKFKNKKDMRKNFGAEAWEEIRSAEEMEQAALELGFLPFFGIPGFSIEERIAEEYWFSDEAEGAWEWKGPVIREGHCAYGKFFAKKAGYVSLEWLPDLMNYRRAQQYAKDEDTAALDDVVLQTIGGAGHVTVKDLRRMLGFARGRSRRTATDLVNEIPEEERVSLEPILTRLMMEVRVVIADFEYNIDRHGNRYGWGVGRTPEESRQRIYEHLRGLFPEATEKQVGRLIG